MNRLRLTGPPFGFKLHERLILVSNRERLFRHSFARDPSPYTMPSHLPYLDEFLSSFLMDVVHRAIDGTLARTNRVLVDTVRYDETILNATPLCAEDSFFWIEWLLRALVQTGAA